MGHGEMPSQQTTDAPWPPLIEVDATVKAKVRVNFPSKDHDKFLTNS
jgi:hypothetical protein